MKLEVKGKLWDRLLETKAGRFASVLDELLYSRLELDSGLGTRLALRYETHDKCEDHTPEKTETFLRKLRDYLYQAGLEELG
jgi:hypothetical protein